MKLIKDDLCAVFSGSFYALAYWIPEIGDSIWLTQVPFLFVLLNSKRSLLRYGLIYGLGYGLICFLWAPGAVQRISGLGGLFPIAFYLLLVLLLAFWPLIFTLLLQFLKKYIKTNTPFHLLWVLPALWLCVEWLNLLTVKQFPWTQFQIGYRLAHNLFAIQIVSVTGIWGLSFLILLVNLLFAFAILKKQKQWAIAGIAVVLLLHGYGWLALRHADSQSAGKTVRIALMQENISSDTEWNDTTGDSLVQVLFGLAHDAVQTGPDIIVWTETFLPWVFRPDDNFLPEMLKITWPAQAGQVLGMSMPVQGGSGHVTNSALYIHPDGRISDKSDKEHLLLLMEKPLTFWKPLAQMQLQRYRIGMFQNVVAGKNSGILKTDHGRAGVRICNEWLMPGPARKSVQAGAGFLLNLSNNAYFKHQFLPQVQWLETRIRAVENRRDVAVACNLGFSGFISASGRIFNKTRSETAQCLPVTLHTLYGKSFYTKYGDWLPMAGFLSLLILIGSTFLKRSKA